MRRISRRVLPLAGLLAATLAITPALADKPEPKPKKDKKEHPAHPAHPAKPPKPKPKKPPQIAPPCTGDPAAVQRMDLQVAGQWTWGLYALPAKAPRGLVVFMHGYGHTAESWRQHIANTARQLDVVALAMDNRGQLDYAPGALPVSRGWRVAEGAEDSVAAARYFEDRCGGFATTVAYGVGMGGNTSGLAVALQGKRKNGSPLFDWWFDVEGAVNVTETYLQARAQHAATNDTAAGDLRDDIEWEMGENGARGTLEQRPSVYLERTVVNRVGDIKAAGIRGVVVVHGLADGQVPYSQSRELVARLRLLKVPVDLFTVATRSGQAGSGTTIDREVSRLVPGYTSPFAGHESETSESQLVVATGLRRLAALFESRAVPTCREWLVDGTLQPAGMAVTSVC